MRGSLALVLLSHSCASSKMVADAISERGEGVSLVPVALKPLEAPPSPPGAGVVIKESTESPAVGHSSSGFGINIAQTLREIKGPNAHREPALFIIVVLLPQCYIGNLCALLFC